MMKKQTWFHLGGRRAALGAAGLMALLAAPPRQKRQLRQPRRPKKRQTMWKKRSG